MQSKLQSKLPLPLPSPSPSPSQLQLLSPSRWCYSSDPMKSPSNSHRYTVTVNAFDSNIGEVSTSESTKALNLADFHKYFFGDDYHNILKLPKPDHMASRSKATGSGSPGINGKTKGWESSRGGAGSQLLSWNLSSRNSNTDKINTAVTVTVTQSQSPPNADTVQSSEALFNKDGFDRYFFDKLEV